MAPSTNTKKRTWHPVPMAFLQRIYERLPQNYQARDIVTVMAAIMDLPESKIPPSRAQAVKEKMLVHRWIRPIIPENRQNRAAYRWEKVR